MYTQTEQQEITEESQGVEFKGRCCFKEGRNTPHFQMRYKDMRGYPPKKQNYLLEGGFLEVQDSFTG